MPTLTIRDNISQLAFEDQTYTDAFWHLLRLLTATR